ncbi:unnamed protein product [Alopecurus aequalis]
MFLWMLLLLLGLQAASFTPTLHAKAHGHGYRVIATNKLEPKSVCSALRVTPSTNRTWLPLYHRHGPCSPPHSVQRTPSSIFHRDQARAVAIQQRLSKSATVPTALGTDLGLGSLEYVVAVGLGTPPVRQTLLIDTGSDLSWVQCRPCPHPPCHRQRDALFDPTKSSTYSPFRCGSPACARLAAENATNGCSGSNRCRYVVNYGDGSNTTGTYSADTLTVTPSDVMTNFRFGCSHAETGFTDADLTDGLLGLGGDADSLVSQAGQRAFSYCLPPTASGTGFLTLGVPRVSSSRFAVTRLYRSAQAQFATFYFVILEAITVARRRLDVPPSVFSAGAIMDSGTIITRLPLAAYSKLSAAFRDEMIKMYLPAPPAGILDTCFNLTGVSNLRLPRVALVFQGGVSVELHQSGIIQYGCLAFASAGRSAGIIGNVQQRTLEVFYDIAGGAVGFRRHAC